MARCAQHLFFLMRRPPPRSTLFPSTTLFRSPLVTIPTTIRSRDVLTLNGRPIGLWRANIIPAPSLEQWLFYGTWHRSEEHTPELQSRQYLECRLLLEKK